MVSRRWTPGFGFLRGGGLACLCLLSSLPSWAASISGFTPDRGPTGTEVTVFGSGLQTTTFVYFGSTDATGEILARSSTSVRVRVPASALTGQISIFSSGAGAASSAAIFVAAPRIDSFTPTSGGPGTLITILGANLAAGNGFGLGNVTNVTIGGERALFQIVGLTQIKALVPTNTVIGPITVANEAGSFSSFEKFQASPLITGVSPFKGRPGDPIEVRGRNLDATVRVEFEAVPARFTVVSRTNLVAYVPTNAVNARIVLTSATGAISTTNNIAVLPRVFSFSPDFGPAGASVQIAGGGFHGLTDVQFSGVKATITARSLNAITATAPAGATNGPLTLITTNGTFTTAETFQFPARLDTFAPTFGRRGDLITLDGAYLDGVSAVRIHGVEAPFTRSGSGRLLVTVPALATTGRLTLATRAGELTSASDFGVRPLIDGVTPTSAPIGSAVFLTGSALTNLAWVRLGGLDTPFNVIQSTNVRVVIPVGAYSGSFRVRTADGLEVDAPGNFFVEGARPVISTFTPNNGAAGTRVTLVGQGFRSLSKVQFNGVEAIFQIVTPTQILAFVPAGASTGPIAVTTLDGVGLSATSFRFVDVPVTLSAKLDQGLLLLAWPASAVGYRLESTPAIGAGPATAWTEVETAPDLFAGQWRVSLPLTESSAGLFYRLQK